MTRPPHRLPAPIFDKLLELELAARVDAGLLSELEAEQARGRVTSGADSRYILAVARTGALRDELAELILEAIEGGRS